MMSSKKKNLFQMILAAMFLALAEVLPSFTGPIFGQAILPMHLPVLLCGFFCGPWYALAIGFVAPLLHFLLTGMPAVIPGGLAMSFELATYGLVSGLLSQRLPQKPLYVYISLITAMLSGRVVWGIVSAILIGVGDNLFGLSAFVNGAFLNAIPGIIVQLILIPVLVIAVRKAVRKENLGS